MWRELPGRRVLGECQTGDLTYRDWRLVVEVGDAAGRSVAHAVVVAEVGHGGVNVLGAFAGLETVDDFGHFGVEGFSGFVAHFAHEVRQGARVLGLEAGHERLIVGQGVETAVFRARDRDAAYEPAQVVAAADGAAGGFVACL